jgi:outer membrane immunogenic protein
MKKLLLLFTITTACSLFTSSAHAQNFGGGVIGGVTASQIIGTDIWGFQKIGVVAGVYADRAIKKKSGIQIEMLFIQKGSRKVTKYPNGGGTTFTNRNLNYIDVPVLFKSKLKGRFGFELGLSFGVLLDTKFKTENGDCDLCDPNTQDFNRFEFGCLGGFNFRVSKSFDLNLRYLNSIIRIRKHQGGQVQNTGLELNRGEYNSVLAFTLRYVITRTND